MKIENSQNKFARHLTPPLNFSATTGGFMFTSKKMTSLLGALMSSVVLSSACAAAPAGTTSPNSEGANTQNSLQRPNQETGNTSSASAGASSTGSTTGGDGSDSVAVQFPVVVLIPMEVRADPDLANGCWVRLFDGTNYKGKDELTIAGPIEMKSLKTASGINWRKRADSLIVGPKANVSVYENSFFKNKTLTFKADQKVPSLRKDLGFLHSIDSLKITCIK